MSELLERLKKKQAERDPESQARSLSIVQDPSADLNTRLREKQRLREQGVHAPDPTGFDIEQRKTFLAKDVGQTTLGKQDVGAGVRFDLGLSDTFEEKRVKFLDKFPEGEFFEVREPPKATGRAVETGKGGTTILFRRHQGEDFAELDRSLLEKSEMLADVADLSGEVPAAAFEVLFTRGGGLVKQLLGVAAGNVTGDALKEAVEGVRGYRRETIGEFTRRTATRSTVAVVGAGATVVVSGPLNAIRGAASLPIAKSAAAAQRAAVKMGGVPEPLPPGAFRRTVRRIPGGKTVDKALFPKTPGLLPSQIARSPLIRKMGGQASVVLKTMGDYINRQQATLVRSLSALREGDLKKVLRGELTALHEAAKTQIIRAAKIRPRDLSATGSRLQQGIAEYDELATTLVNFAYKSARQIEAPNLDISSLATVAKEMRAGVTGISREGKEIALSGPEQKLDEILGKILDLDPSLRPTVTPSGIISDGVEQLRALRSQLWDLKTPPAGQTRSTDNKHAARIYSAITHVLKNPRNASPKFLAAWKEANDLASGRFDVMDKMVVINAAKSETPAQLAKRLAQPDQVDNLRILQEILPPSRYREFQRGVQAEFISPRNIDGLTKRLDSFDQSTLDLLVPKADQKSLRFVGEQIDNLNRADIKGVLANQTGVARVLDELIDTGNISRIDEIMRTALVTRDSPLRRSVRAGLMERVWRKSVKKIEGNPTIDRKAFVAEMKVLRQTGAIRFLERNDIRALNELDTLAEFIPEVVDMGAALQAGELVKQTRGGLLSAESAKNAIGIIFEHAGTGRLLTSRIFQRIFLGKGKKPLEFNKLRVLGAILAQINRDLEGEKQ